MTHIQLVSKVGPDGFLRVPVPQEMNGQELEILLVIQPIQPQVKRETGWTADFGDTRINLTGLGDLSGLTFLIRISYPKNLWYSTPCVCQLVVIT